MSKEKKNDEKVEVKFLTSLVMSVNDVDDVLKHLQFTIVQEVESKKMRCFFDIVDPSQIKLRQE